MEFAGVKPEQLGRVKVTSVSECFLAEKEWQTVTRRGAVLACVGVPTVRKIEVELLMRAKNRSALPLLLEKVRAWLEESGHTADPATLTEVPDPCEGRFDTLARAIAHIDHILRFPDLLLII